MEDKCEKTKIVFSHCNLCLMAQMLQSCSFKEQHGVEKQRRKEDKMDYKIVNLKKEEWKGYPLLIGYTTNEYYDVVVDRGDKGFSLNIEKKRFDKPVTHTPEEYNFPDKLFDDYRPNSHAWGVIIDGKLIAAIETEQEEWNRRLRVHELWVADEYHKMGIGKALMNIAKEQARHARNRAIVLETQSCNVNAIGFYLHEGFTLIGLDTCCYANNDLERKEVRLELGWFPKRKPRLTRDELEIRSECEEEYHEVERLAQRAFWNKHNLGCDEHLLVHNMRDDEAYIPEISRIAIKDGEIIGHIMYSKAYVLDGDIRHEVLTFGPLCVSPEWQGAGVGEILVKETMKLAADAGYKAIIIFGEPDYYPRLGFKTCDNFGVTTADGKNFDAFMGIEVVADGMKGIHGKFFEAEVFDNLPAEDVEELNRQFPLLEKQYFPTQWGE